MRAVNVTSGSVLATKLSVAVSLLSRSKGLLGRDGLAAGEGLLISPCLGVHTFFMKFPIDVVFLDKDNRVIQVKQRLKPYRITELLLSSSRIIELPAGAISASNTAVGNLIAID